MPKFSKTSSDRLSTCHPDLQLIFNEVIKTHDCTIICGARTLEEQQKASKGGFSKIDGITKKSEHQVSKEKPLSTAVDALPCPISWSDTKGHKEFSNFVLSKAKDLGIDLVWGGNWKMRDNPHYQLGK